MVDQNVLERLLSGLGDVQPERRAHLNVLLSQVDLKFVPYVLPRLFKEFESVNFKVRIDVLQHLEHFMNRIRLEMGFTYLGSIELQQQSYTSFPNSLSKLAEMNEEYQLLKRKKQEEMANNRVEERIQPELSLASSTVEGPLSLDEFSLKELLEDSLNVLVTAMWQDPSSEVQKVASEALGRLGGGHVIFNQIIALLESEDTAKRVEALKCLAFVGVLTQPALESLLKCFSDSIAAVRVEACKVACVLKSHDPSLLYALSERLKDYDWKVRAYAVKGEIYFEVYKFY
jgi:HEAT repeat protein